MTKSIVSKIPGVTLSSIRTMPGFKETQEMRAKHSENLIGVSLIECDKRKDGTTVGMYDVDGYYIVPGTDALPVRQIRRYDVKTYEKAEERARKDGLTSGIMIECLISEPAPCNLEMVDFRKYLSENSRSPLRLLDSSS